MKKGKIIDIIELKDNKIRKPFAPKIKIFKNKKVYNRKQKYIVKYKEPYGSLYLT